MTVAERKSVKVVKTSLGVTLYTHIPNTVVVARGERRIGYVLKVESGWKFNVTNRYGSPKAEGGYFVTKLHAIEALLVAYVEVCEDALHNHPD